MTPSEQKLALALGVVLIGGGAFIGLTKLKSWMPGPLKPPPAGLRLTNYSHTKIFGNSGPPG